MPVGLEQSPVGLQYAPPEARILPTTPGLLYTIRHTMPKGAVTFCYLHTVAAQAFNDNLVGTYCR